MAAPEFDNSRLFISTEESALVRMLKKYGDHRFTGFPSRRSASAATPAWLPGWTCVFFVFIDSGDDNPGFNFLFRLRQPCDNCSSFIEHLVHALQLTALDCVLHGFISNEGEFRLAVSKILKQNHVVRTFYGLMFYS